MSDTSTADSLRSAVQRLVRRLNATDPANGLPSGQRSVLALLDLNDGLTGADLARREQVTPQAINVVVNAVVAQGLVERRPDPDDRRRQRLHLTAEGRRVTHEVRDSKTSWLEARLDTLTKQERDALAAALPVLHRLTESE